MVERGTPAEKILVLHNCPDPRIFDLNLITDTERKNRKLSVMHHGTLLRRYGEDVLFESFAEFCRTFQTRGWRYMAMAICFQNWSAVPRNPIFGVGSRCTVTSVKRRLHRRWQGLTFRWRPTGTTNFSISYFPLKCSRRSRWAVQSSRVPRTCSLNSSARAVLNSSHPAMLMRWLPQWSAWQKTPALRRVAFRGAAPGLGVYGNAKNKI